MSSPGAVAAPQARLPTSAPVTIQVPHFSKQSPVLTSGIWNWTHNISQIYWTQELLFLKIHACKHVKSLQSCLTLCNPMDCSPPGSSVHGILQARILKWVALPSSMGSSRPGDRTCVSHISCTGRWVPYHLRQQGTLDSTWLVAKTRTEHSIQGSVLTRFS